MHSKISRRGGERRVPSLRSPGIQFYGTELALVGTQQLKQDQDGSRQEG